MNFSNILNLSIKASELNYPEWTMRCVIIFVALALASVIFYRVAKWFNSLEPKETKQPESDDEFFFGAITDWSEWK